MSAKKGRRSLTAAAAEDERRQGFRAVGVMTSKLAAPIVVKRGGGILVRLKTDWPAIVGARWASAAWPAGLGSDGALKLHTTPTAAIEIQHRAPLLIERINLYFGRQAVTRLVILQCAVTPPRESGGTAPRAAAGDAAETFDHRLRDIGDVELRSALARLGKAVTHTGR